MLSIYTGQDMFSESATAQWMLGSPRGQTVSPSAQKGLEDSCSQPADTDGNNDKHKDLSSHTTQHKWKNYHFFKL